MSEGTFSHVVTQILLFCSCALSVVLLLLYEWYIYQNILYFCILYSYMNNEEKKIFINTGQLVFSYSQVTLICQ